MAKSWVCMDCRFSVGVDAQEEPSCPHFTPEYWESQGYKRNWGDAAVMMYPDLEILLKLDEHGQAAYVILAPACGIRRPVMLKDNWGGL